MGMQDQYDDGRYDPALGISPELSFVRAHPFTVQRGGIKYPSPKGTTMATTNRAALQKELRTAEELHASLVLHIEKMKQTLKDAAIPPRPAGNRYKVHLYFGSHGKRYEFLLLRTPDGRWFTTGTTEETKVFRDWPALVAWLDGPDVHSHSDLIELTESGVTYDTKTGATSEVPF